MKRLALLAALALAACPTEPYRYTFQHADGLACPRDYTRIRGFFTERDGSHEDACQAPPHLATEYTFDVLKAGESATLTLLAPQPSLLKSEVMQ